MVDLQLMAASFYFYDLETTGINSRTGRIMQFAGQRTDMDLQPIGEPDNLLIKLTNEIVPDPEAILITGITPQSTQAEGLTEVEFLTYFEKHICAAHTIFVGYNNIRFDDEFMRHTLYRNFYDAYEWCWQDSRGRWDLLDVIRMTRALRPDGITWPVTPDGTPTNRLELLTSMNGLDHANAHDALSDVSATIVLAQLLRNKQPKLFDFLLSMRDKNKVKELVLSGQPFVYTSGKYANMYEKTTIVTSLGEHPGKQGIVVYDLRRDPSFLANKSAEELAQLWHARTDDETMRFPIKTLQFNRAPAVAPVGVLTEENKQRLHLDMAIIAENRKKLAAIDGLREKLLGAIDQMDAFRQSSYKSQEQDVDNLLYNGFFSDQDKTAMGVVRAADKNTIQDIQLSFKDERLETLLPLYKARNYPTKLSSEERLNWEKYRYNKLLGGGQDSVLNKYFMRLQELKATPDLSANHQYLLEELQLYGESIMPEPLDEDE